MNSNKRPLAVTFLALLYVSVGVGGLIQHFPDIRATAHWHSEDLWLEAIELCAIVCGVFLYRGANWARWLAVGWVVLHVVLSVVDNSHGLLVHGILAAGIAWLLFRCESNEYFGSAQQRPS